MALTCTHLPAGLLQRRVLVPQPLALQLAAAKRLLAAPQLVLQALGRRLQPGGSRMGGRQLLAGGVQRALKRGAVGCRNVGGAEVCRGWSGTSACGVARRVAAW